jgi:hypothetical protein
MNDCGCCCGGDSSSNDEIKANESKAKLDQILEEVKQTRKKSQK